MKSTQQSPPILGIALAAGAGLAAYAWRRKVTGKPVLPSLTSAIAVATSAATALRGLLAHRSDGRLTIEEK